MGASILINLAGLFLMILAAGFLSSVNPSGLACTLFQTGCPQSAKINPPPVSVEVIIPEPASSTSLSYTPALTLTATPEATTNPTSTPAPTPRCLRLNIPISRNTSYVAKQGDNLSCIAVRAGVALSELLDANPQIEEPDLIIIDEIIRIP